MHVGVAAFANMLNAGTMLQLQSLSFFRIVRHSDLHAWGMYALY